MLFNNNTEANMDKYERYSFSCVAFAFLLLVFIYISSALTSHLIENGKIEQYFYSDQLGPIGDFFSGIVTPFVSLAAFVLLYGSYLLQKKELKESSQALKEQAKSLEKQIQIIEKQNDQKIFFDLLNILDNNRNACKGNTNVIKYLKTLPINTEKDSDYFSQVNEIFSYYKINIEVPNALAMLKKNHDKAYNAIRFSASEDLHRYFESMTVVLKFLFDYKAKENSSEFFNLFKLAFLSGISLNEKRYLIIYANSDFKFKDSFTIKKLDDLGLLKWNNEGIDYTGKLNK